MAIGGPNIKDPGTDAPSIIWYWSQNNVCLSSDVKAYIVVLCLKCGTIAIKLRQGNQSLNGAKRRATDSAAGLAANGT